MWWSSMIPAYGAWCVIMWAGHMIARTGGELRAVGAVWLCAGLAVNAKSTTMTHAWMVVISLILGVVTLKGINKKLELAEARFIIGHF